MKVGAIPYASNFLKEQQQTTIAEFIDREVLASEPVEEPGYVFDTTLMKTNQQLLNEIRIPVWFKGLRYRYHIVSPQF